MISNVYFWVSREKTSRFFKREQNSARNGSTPFLHAAHGPLLTRVSRTARAVSNPIFETNYSFCIDSCFNTDCSCKICTLLDRLKLISAECRRRISGIDEMSTKRCKILLDHSPNFDKIAKFQCWKFSYLV